MSRAVLDSSVLISAFIKPRGSNPAALLQAARRGACQICLSPPILAETSRILLTGRLRRGYVYTDDNVRRYLEGLARQAILIDEIPALRVVPADPDDDMVVATAVAGSASYIVTGDGHLLSLGEYEGIRLVTPRQFLEILTIR